jgi:DNA-binding transcriptional regulator GbsR (MarR family)
VADQIGLLMGFFGFKRIHGRVWAILFLAEAPLPASEIRRRLGISVGATSMALGELRRWGAVREVRAGSRSLHYEPETNIWRLVSRVLQDRERRLLDDTLLAFEDALGAMRARGSPTPPASVHRVEKLIWLTKLARGMLEMLASQGALAAQDVRKMRV